MWICLRVGSGIGPLTTAPVLLTVRMIFSALLSTSVWSNDLSLIRMVWFARLIEE